MEKIRIDILPNLYLKEDGTFNTKEKTFAEGFTAQG